MSATMTEPKRSPWDLTDLYDSPDDPAFEQDLAATRERVRAFRERYRGRIGDLSAQELVEALEELDEIEAAHVRPAVFAHLLFATDTADPDLGRAAAAGAGVERGPREGALRAARVGAVPDEAPRSCSPTQRSSAGRTSSARAASARTSYRSRRRRSSREEVRVRPGRLGPISASLTSALTASVDGEEISFEQALARLYSPDREVRRTAAEAVTDGLRPGLRTRAYVFNTLLLDKSIDDRLRSACTGSPRGTCPTRSPERRSRRSVAAVVSRRHPAALLMHGRHALLGLGERMAYYDRMAPVSSDEFKLSWTTPAMWCSRRGQRVLGRGRGHRVRLLRAQLDRRAGAAEQANGAFA